MKRTADDAAVTRQKLLDAGIRVFDRRGYVAATLGEIATEARVSRGAVYHHFADKADLYITAIADRWSRVGDALWRHLIADGPVGELLRGFLTSFHGALADDPAFRELLRVTVGGTENLPELERGMRVRRDIVRGWANHLMVLFERAEREGLLRQGLTPRGAAGVVVANLTGAVVASTLGLDGLADEPAGVDAVADAVAAGLLR